jgi:3-hydroxyacyl-[acyl-carrier-protein] dehydratase
MTLEVHRTIPADHPSLPGHFPNAPLVAGVLILDEVFAALLDWQKNCQVTGIRTVKFLQPLKPEQPFTICLSGCKDDVSKINFCCRIESRVIAEGQLKICREGKITS